MSDEADVAVLERPIIPLTMDAKPHNGWIDDVERIANGLEPLDPKRDFRDKRTGLGGQVLLLHLCRQFKRVIAPVGRRFGKTTTLGFLFMEEAARTAGMYFAGVFEQDHPKAKAVMDVFIAAYGGDPKKNPDSLIESINRSEGQGRHIVLKPMMVAGAEDVGNEGATIYFWSSKHPHYNAVRGIPHAFHRIVTDEAALIRGECISRVVLPMLLDVDGSLLVIGTPDVEGCGNYWFETFWARAMSTKKKWARYAGMNFPTDANPHLPQAALDELDAEYEHDEVARIQEREGRFPDSIGGVFGNLSRFFTLQPLQGPRPHWVTEAARGAGIDPQDVRCSFSQLELPHGTRCAVGSDFARKMDESIFSVMRLDNGEQAAVFALKGEDYEEQAKFLQAVRAHYGRTTSLQCDANGVGDGMCLILEKRLNEPVTRHIWTAHNKESYVRQLVTLCKVGGVKLIDTPEQREQFRIYIGEKNPKTQRMRYSHPDGAHDDYVDAVLFTVEQLMVPMRPDEDSSGESGVPSSADEPKRGTYDEMRQQADERKMMDFVIDTTI